MSCVLLGHSWSPTLSVIDQSPVAGKVVAAPGATSTVLFFGTATILAATPGGCCEMLAVMIELVVPRRELLPAVSNKATVSQGVGIGMQTPLVFWWPGGHSQPPLGVRTNVGMQRMDSTVSGHLVLISLATAKELPRLSVFPEILI
jgi:hypothetical protein